MGNAEMVQPKVDFFASELLMPVILLPIPLRYLFGLLSPSVRITTTSGTIVAKEKKLLASSRDSVSGHTGDNYN